jgi:predicted PurR-regulated permease PerM
MAKESYTKYVLIGLILILAALVFLILRPFISSILSAFVMAYLFYPLYKFIKKYLKRESLAAFFVSLVIVLLFTVPMVFVANSVSTEARINYIFIKKILATGSFFDKDCTDPGILCKVSGFLGEYLTDPQIKFQLTNITNKVTDFFINMASNFIFSIPVFLLKFFIMLFIVFYLFKEGDDVVLRIRNLLPLKKLHRKSLFDHMSEVTYAVVYGHILTAAIQAIIGIIAFWIFGVTSPILWGAIMFIFALIPFLGTPVVWVPAVVIKAMMNHPFQAIGLLFAGIFISTIDNFLRPKLISGKASVHPIIVLLGVLGGLAFFGAPGLIIGPVVLSIFLTFVKIYEEEKIEA